MTLVFSLPVAISTASASTTTPTAMARMAEPSLDTASSTRESPSTTKPMISTPVTGTSTGDIRRLRMEALTAGSPVAWSA
ncbi:hypothetical protein B7486_72295, partial [cyanobacterium TDX16]